jgi:hypothetical protein
MGMMKPLSKDRWDFATAAHLLNRAGFGGPPPVTKASDFSGTATFTDTPNPATNNSWRFRSVP